MKERTEDKVMAIVGGHSRCYLGEMDTQSRLVEDLNLDSIDAVEIVIDLEHEFDIHVEYDDIMRMKTVQDVIDYVKEKGGAR